LPSEKGAVGYGLISRQTRDDSEGRERKKRNQMLKKPVVASKQREKVRGNARRGGSTSRWGNKREASRGKKKRRSKNKCDR